MDLHDPRHGTPAGFSAGCKDHDTCPQAPYSCRTARTAAQQDYRRRQAADAAAGITEGARLSQVQRRLEQTIEAVGIRQVAARTQMSMNSINDVREQYGALLPYETAERLDHAWTWFVRGVDSTAPDFVHGRGAASYIAGCRCRPCRAGMTKANATQRMGLLRPESWLSAAEADLVRAHATRLAKLSNAQHAARACGVPTSTFHAIIKGHNEGMRRPVAEKIIATKPSDLEAVAALVPADATHHHVWTLMALGYNMRWQREEIGVGPDTLSKLRPGKVVTVAIAGAVADLAARIGEKPATLADGISEKSAARARATALRAGFYPPAAYDDNRQLVLRAIPDHPWSRLDERAAKALTGAYLAGKGMTPAQISRETGSAPSTLTKHQERVWGYTYLRDGDLDFKASRARIREIVAIYHSWEAGEVGPITAAAMVGFGFHRTNCPVEAREHPEVVALRAAEAAAAASEDEAA